MSLTRRERRSMPGRCRVRPPRLRRLANPHLDGGVLSRDASRSERGSIGVGVESAHRPSRAPPCMQRCTSPHGSRRDSPRGVLVSAHCLKDLRRRHVVQRGERGRLADCVEHACVNAGRPMEPDAAVHDAMPPQRRSAARPCFAQQSAPTGNLSFHFSSPAQHSERTLAARVARCSRLGGGGAG